MVDTDVVVIGMYVSKLLNTAELELWIELGTEIHAVIFLKIMEKKLHLGFESVSWNHWIVSKTFRTYLKKK